MKFPSVPKVLCSEEWDRWMDTEMENNANELRTLCACKLQLQINQCVKSYHPKDVQIPDIRPPNKEHKERLKGGMCKSFHIFQKKSAKNPETKTSFSAHVANQKLGRKPSPRWWWVLEAMARYLTVCLLRRSNLGTEQTTEENVWDARQRASIKECLCSSPVWDRARHNQNTSSFCVVPLAAEDYIEQLSARRLMSSLWTN